MLTSLKLKILMLNILGANLGFIRQEMKNSKANPCLPIETLKASVKPARVLKMQTLEISRWISKK